MISDIENNVRVVLLGHGDICAEHWTIDSPCKEVIVLSEHRIKGAQNITQIPASEKAVVIGFENAEAALGYLVAGVHVLHSFDTLTENDVKLVEVLHSSLGSILKQREIQGT